MEFDHLFICVDKPAAGADQLKEFGLTEGTSNQHPGQGTANRRFFFQNSFIELLFITDQVELNSELTKPTKLHERFPSGFYTASPFGVCFRPSNGNTEVPFQSWNYKPQFLPPGLHIPVAKSPAIEPMWFFLSFGSRPDMASPEKRQPTEHSCGFNNITSVNIIAPLSDGISTAGIEASNVAGVEFSKGPEHLLQIGFDSVSKGNQKDFRPILPVVFQW